MSHFELQPDQKVGIFLGQDENFKLERHLKLTFDHVKKAAKGNLFLEQKRPKNISKSSARRTKKPRPILIVFCINFVQ